ncbi:MAG: class I SAM-dependent methyltransferase [Nitrososphaeria archaeon]
MMLLFQNSNSFLKKRIRRAIEIIKDEGVKVFFKKSLIYGLKKSGLILPYALLKIKLINQKNNLNLNEYVNFAFNDLSGLIKPIQIYNEILELLEIIQKIKPKTVLEIGTANGGTLFLFSRVASEDATIISIDLPGGKFGGGYPQWKRLLYKSFALPKQKIYLLRMDSHENETLEQVKAILKGRRLDFLFIDGDHTYEGVKKDFEMYSKLVERGSVIALHDIVHHPNVPECQVEVLWGEIKQRYKTKEIIFEPGQTWAGIGVIFT